MTYSVGDLVEMARALSEDEFDEQFKQHFQGEPGQLPSYPEAVRQSLRSPAVSANGSRQLIPQAADGVAENNFNSEDQTPKLIVKFKVKAHEKSIKDDDNADLVKDTNLDQDFVDQPLATLR